MNTKAIDNQPEFDPELLKMYLKLSPEQRLETMFELNAFLWEAMPEKNKRAWEKMKERGW